MKNLIQIFLLVGVLSCYARWTPDTSQIFVMTGDRLDHTESMLRDYTGAQDRSGDIGHYYFSGELLCRAKYWELRDGRELIIIYRSSKNSIAIIQKLVLRIPLGEKGKYSHYRVDSGVELPYAECEITRLHLEKYVEQVAASDR